MEMFMNVKGKVVVELRDAKWLWDLTLQYDVSHHVNDFNTKL